VRVNGICIVTDDVARLRSFYADALRAEAEGDDTFTAFRTAGGALSLFSSDGMEQMAPGSMAQAGVGRYTLEIEVDDVDAEFDRLSTLGCVIVKPPTTQPWGRRSVWVRDPDGNILNFYANVPPLTE
jgi:catechol 2,3-dioxygenase-like lactoylglutathione lyase family enzyme